jgi:hypothetical protein
MIENREKPELLLFSLISRSFELRHFLSRGRFGPNNITATEPSGTTRRGLWPGIASVVTPVGSNRIQPKTSIRSKLVVQRLATHEIDG